MGGDIFDHRDFAGVGDVGEQFQLEVVIPILHQIRDGGSRSLDWRTFSLWRDGGQSKERRTISKQSREFLVKR